MGRLTNELLERRGGRRVCAYGEGDDDNSLEEDFDKWREVMWPAMLKSFHPHKQKAEQEEGNTLMKMQADKPVTKIELEYTTNIVSKEEADQMLTGREYDIGHLSVESMKFEMKSAKLTPALAKLAPGLTSRGPSMDPSKLQINSSSKFYFLATDCPVTVNRELRQSTDGGSTKHIEVDISKSFLKYQTADNLAVLPENKPEIVTDVCTNMGYNQEDYFVIAPCNANNTKFKHMFPTPCTIGDALKRYCDIQSIPRHAVMCSLQPYVTDPKQHKWLADLTDKSNRAQFKAYIEEGGRSLSVLLSKEGDLSSCKLPLADFIHIAPRLQPRYYTISSSSSVHPTSIHVTVALAEKILPDGRKFLGVCSSDLVSHVPATATATAPTTAPTTAPATTAADTGTGSASATDTTGTTGTGTSMLRVFVRASTFRLPASLNTPVLMIGKG
jgi:NADPH-ferrihemoprotein reductase